MNPLTKLIDEDYQKAYRAQEKDVVEVLRLLKTQLTNAEIEKRTKENKREVELTEEEALAVAKRQMKNLEESVALFRQGGREDLAKNTEAEIKIIKRYLPEELSEEAVRAVVKAKIENLGEVGPSEFGKVMGEVMKELKGKAGGEIVMKIVKELLK